MHFYTAHGHLRGSGDLSVPSDEFGRGVTSEPVRRRKGGHDMTTTPQEPGSDPDITPTGEPLEPVDPIDPSEPTDPGETDNPD